MPHINLTVGAREIERIIPNADELLLEFRSDRGYHYLNYSPITPADRVVPEDLAVTLLVNSQASGRAFHSLMEKSNGIDLTILPKKPLENTSEKERAIIAALIAGMAQLSGFAASVATKVLHKKRPYLIPILDNQAIFGAYMNAEWPQKPARGDSIKDENLIRKALDWITFDVRRQENKDAWERLHTIEPNRSRIQLFDCVWWKYFRKVQPVVK